MVLQNSTQRDTVLQNSHLIKKEMKPLCIRPDYNISKRREIKHVSSGPTVKYLNEVNGLQYLGNTIPKNGHVPRIKLNQTQNIA
jgi:hypothetical protein